MEPFLLCLAVFLVLVVWSIDLWRKNRNLPPGPWGLPFLGYYPFLGDAAHVKFQEKAKFYGNVMSFRTIGGYLVVVLNGLDTIKEVLYTRAEEFIGRPKDFTLLESVSDGFGVAQEEGESWRDLRRFFLSKAKDYGFGKIEIEDHMQDLVQQMIRDIRAFNGKSFELLPQITHVTTNVITDILFKSQFKKDNPKFMTIVHGLPKLFSIFTANTHFIVGSYMRLVLKFTATGRVSCQARDEMKAHVDEIIEEHIRTFDSGHLRDFIDAYLEQMRILEEKGQLHGSLFTSTAY